MGLTPMIQFSCEKEAPKQAVCRGWSDLRPSQSRSHDTALCPVRCICEGTMNRRSLLKSLSLLPVLALPKTELPKVDENVVHYKGWECCWQDWVPSINQAIFVGKWVAHRKDVRYMAYSTYPGKAGWFFVDQMMETSCHWDQEVPTLVTRLQSPEKFDGFKRAALKSLFLLIDKNDVPRHWRG
jgi:hypothetical protein